MNFELLNHIDLDEYLVKEITDLAANDEVGILHCRDLLLNGDLNKLAKKSSAMKLAATLKAAEITHKKYKEKQISDEIFYDTFSDIKIWCENCNNKGLENINWLKNHINFELFKIGRLQYQLFKLNNPRLNYNKLPVSYGENVIYVHIPQGEKLDYNACLNSLSFANNFFEKYFSEFNYSYYFCESWLLFEGNKFFMDKNSNILKFADLFNVHYSINDEKQEFERIFGFDKNICKIAKRRRFYKNKSDINRLPEFTSLQKNAKEYLINNGRFGEGIGTIPKSKYIK